MMIGLTQFLFLVHLVINCCINASAAFTTTSRELFLNKNSLTSIGDVVQNSRTSILFASPLFDTICLPSVLLSEGGGSVLGFFNTIQDDHTFLQGLLLTIAIKLAIGEIRRRVEKPIMDEAGRRIGEKAKEKLTPDTAEIKLSDWAKLGGCVAMDLAGDASELIPVLGEFTDVAFAPAEAAMLQLLFKSPVISAFGFVEEILPFTDVVPTFTMSWILSTLFPTTPLAKSLLPAKETGKSTN